MTDPAPMSIERHQWSAEARALAVQAKVLSGNKLEQLVMRIQRHTGRSKQSCWRFVIQYGIKSKVDHRRWTEEEIEMVREELVKHSVEEVARKLGRTAISVRNMLRRNGLLVRAIRCDLFSLDSIARALHVRKSEVLSWIQRGWLQASTQTQAKRRSYSITAESLAQMYKHYLPELLKRGIPNLILFEAYVQYVHSPKHTAGEQLLVVRRDKRERAAFAAAEEHQLLDESEDDDEESDFGEENHISFS